MSSEREVVEACPTELFIGGKWVAADGGKTLAVEDPATGATLCDVADASPADGKAALDAAVAAQAEWAATPPRERGEILRRTYELMTERADDLALLMTLEMGKPVAESEGEIAYAAEFFRWFAEEAVRIEGGYQIAPNGSGRFLLMRQPVGPCLLITPWNFPAAMGARKIGPAVAAGCTMVIKPAAQTPLSMLKLAELMTEAGLPAGVLNVVTTNDAGGVMEPLIRDGRARKLSFTGSTSVGRKLIEQAADQVLRTSMELGGNAPLLVFEDADLDKAVDGAMLAKFRNIGEACTAANRFIVHEDVADEFARRVTERVNGLKVGRGTDDGVTIGPLINEDAIDKASELLQDAVSRGASVLTGGARVGGTGTFFEPTVVTDVRPGSEILRQEIFGPVLSIIRFSDEDEAVRLANDTEYGLVSYVFTKDLARGQRMIERLETGMMGLNVGVVSNAAAPFGGVKQSGLGREGGFEGIHEYLNTKYTLTPNPFGA